LPEIVHFPVPDSKIDGWTNPLYLPVPLAPKTLRQLQGSQAEILRQICLG